MLILAILFDPNSEIMLRMQGAKTTEKKNDKIRSKFFGETKKDT